MGFQVATKGHYDFVDITDSISGVVTKSGVADGMAFVFITSSTCALTTMEYESGIIKDIIALFERLAPEDADYEHHKRWGDHNGAAHIKSAIIGTNLAVPIENGTLRLGAWQQIVLIDFDERPRTREVIVKITDAR